MSVELLLSLVAAVGTILAGFWVITDWGLKQFDKRLEERFRAQDTARLEGKAAWEGRFTELQGKYEKLNEGYNRILIELPREYVRREDWVRSQTVIESKLDALALRIENVLLKGGQL